MRVAVTGSTGLIGSELLGALSRRGHEVLRLVRSRPAGRGAAWWDPAGGTLDPGVLDGVDAVIHLAGKNVGGRWTEGFKREVLASRVDSTRLLATTMAAMAGGPRVLVTMSGIHWYGADRGDEVLTEASGPGPGFMPTVAQAWEAAADPARDAGIRVAHLRAGVVLSREGGSMGRLLPLFRLGLGGRFGSGRQWWSWVALDDVVGILLHAVENGSVAGPLNATAPNPVTNADFTRRLAAAVGRPAVLPIPRLGPRLLVGEAADELLYGSLRVLPERTVAGGYRFAFDDLDACLVDLLHEPVTA